MHTSRDEVKFSEMISKIYDVTQCDGKNDTIRETSFSSHHFEKVLYAIPQGNKNNRNYTILYEYFTFQE